MNIRYYMNIYSCIFGINAEMKYENAIEINFNREIFVSLTIYIYNKFIALMKAQT